MTIPLSETSADNLVCEVLRNIEGFHEELAELGKDLDSEWAEDTAAGTRPSTLILRAVMGAAIRGLRMGLQHQGIPQPSLDNLETAMRNQLGSIV